MALQFNSTEGAMPTDAADWFFQNSSDGFSISKGGRILSVNQAWCEMTGFESEELIGLTAVDLVHPEDMQEFNQAQSVLYTKGAVVLEHRLRTRDGGWIWVRTSAKQGLDGFALLVIHDINAERLQKAEAELATKSAELLRAAASVYMWRFNPDTGLYTTEQAGADNPENVGVADVSTSQMTENIHPDDRVPFGKAFFPTLQTGQAGQFVYRYARGDDWVRLRSAWRGVRLCESGKWEVRGLTQDITELLDARDAALLGEQAAKDAAETKSQFLANISHEIRTPLNGVVGVLHLLKNEALSPDGRKLLDEAVACGGMLAELLNDVLDFSKIEAGHLELSPEPLDPGAILSSVAQMIRPQIEGKNLYLKIEADAATEWVCVDPVRFRQILFNLVGNAAKFTLRGGVSIKMQGRDEGAEHRLRVEITDTGVGITCEGQAGLFDRFHQGDGSTTRRFGGTGLGLAITRRLAELMGGEIGFDSEAGKGSTFWFDIAAPLVEREDAVKAHAPDLLEGLRLLVVDDNATNRIIASKMLENLGASMETADDGAQGVEAVERGAFDLIFMDMQMPVMDGLEATRRIRTLPAPIGQTPILAMTANVMSHQVAQYRAAGMDGVVAKPLSPAAIIAEIAKLTEEPEASAKVA